MLRHNYPGTAIRLPKTNLRTCLVAEADLAEGETKKLVLRVPEARWGVIGMAEVLDGDDIMVTVEYDGERVLHGLGNALADIAERLWLGPLVLSNAIDLVVTFENRTPGTSTNARLDFFGVSGRVLEQVEQACRARYGRVVTPTWLAGEVTVAAGATERLLIRPPEAVAITNIAFGRGEELMLPFELRTGRDEVLAWKSTINAYTRHTLNAEWRHPPRFQAPLIANRAEPLVVVVTNPTGGAITSYVACESYALPFQPINHQ